MISVMWSPHGPTTQRNPDLLRAFTITCNKWVLETESQTSGYLSLIGVQRLIVICSQALKLPFSFHYRLSSGHHRISRNQFAVFCTLYPWCGLVSCLALLASHIFFLCALSHENVNYFSSSWQRGTGVLSNSTSLIMYCYSLVDWLTH